MGYALPGLFTLYGVVFPVSCRASPAHSGTYAWTTKETLSMENVGLAKKPT